MLTELKYNFTLAPSGYQQVWPWIQLGAAMLFLTLITPAGWLWLAGLVVYVAILRPYQRQPHFIRFITLSESGEWSERRAEEGDGKAEHWRLIAQSKLLPFALFVALRSQYGNTTRYVWVWKDQIDDMCYRRLARVIYRQGLS